MNCEEVEELIGVYVLSALEREEHAAVRDHLASCDNHPEFAPLQAVASSLAFAVPEAAPTPALKARLLEAVRAEVPPTPEARSRSFLDWLGRLRPQVAVPYALAGALGVAVLALLLSNGGRSDEPTTVVLTGPGDARATVRQLDDSIVVMEAEGLEPLTEDRIYQVWGIDDEQVISLGLLGSAPDGQALGAMRADLSNVDSLAVTIEPVRGSPGPTTEPVLESEDIIQG
jgi:anti-sigma-K factor RskA